MKRLALATAAAVLAVSGCAAQPVAAPDVAGCGPADPALATPERPPLFIGSSSIARWASLSKDVDAPAIRCGFWGQQTADMIPLALPVARRYRPSRIFYYAGDNDLAVERSPKTPDDVLANFKRFVQEVRSDPATAGVLVTFLSIKECPARWTLRRKVLETNRKVCHFAETDDGIDFIDVFDSLLKPDGTPNEGLFDPDGLHLNEKGYVEWGKVVRPWIAPSTRAISAFGCSWDRAVVW